MNFKINNPREKLLVCLLLAVILVLFVYFGFRCPVKALLGIPCPGCGMTRAYLSLLRFELVGAFTHHGMFWSMPILLLYYFTDWRLFKSKLLNNSILILIGIGFILNWVLRFII